MAGDIDIVIGAQDKASAVINEVAGKVSGFSGLLAGKLNKTLLGAVASIGAAAGAFFTLNAAISAVNESAANIDSVAKAARGIGSTVADLQAIEFALSAIAGISPEKTVDVLKEMQKIIGETVGPNASAERVGILERLGLDAQTLAQQSPVDQFRTLQAAISKVGSTAERAAIADKLFAGGAKDLLPAFLADVDELNATLEQASTLGLTLTDTQAAGVESMNDAIARATGSLDGMFNKLTAELAPAITIVADAIVEWVPPLVQIADEYLPAIVDGMVVAGGYAKDLGNLLYAASGRVDFVEFARSIDEFGQTSIDWLVKLQEQRQTNHANAVNNAQKLKDLNQQINFADQEAIKAEDARQKAVEATVEALQRKLLVLQTSEDFVKMGEQLALATNDAEADRIALLQRQIAEQEAMNDAIKAQADIEKKLISERGKLEEEVRKAEIDKEEALAASVSGVQASESRLLSRGPEQKDFTKIAASTKETAERLHRIYELLERQDRGEQLSIEVLN